MAGRRLTRRVLLRFTAGLTTILVVGAATLTLLTYVPSTAETIVPVTSRVVEGRYDLLVVGGDPEGVAAAVAGARRGLRTLLLDGRDRLGGLLTAGGLNFLDMNYGPDRELLTAGLFLEFLTAVEGQAFDTRTAVNAFHRMVNAEENLTVILEVAEMRPLVDGTCVVGAAFTAGGTGGPGGQAHVVRAGVCVDATPDAVFAAQAGVGFTRGQEDFGGPAAGMAATLVFEVGGIGLLDWQRLWLHLNLNRTPHTGATRRSAWGFPEFLGGYRPVLPGLQLRGLNIGRQNGGTVLINALQIFGLDPLDPESAAEARARAEDELPRVIEHLRGHVPGFRGAVLSGTADELYVRESRHMLAVYRLTIDDVLENRDFPDRIAFGSYPVDIQALYPGDPGTVIGAPAKYAIPFRCLVPAAVDNLLVVGRSAGYDSLAHGSTRVVPVGMVVGQAAGTAAALALGERVTVRELATDARLVERLQADLQRQGQPLAPFSLPGTTEGLAHREGLLFARRLGLASGGYKNDYRLDAPMPESEYMALLPVLAERAGWPIIKAPVSFWEGNELTLGDVAYVLHNCFAPVSTKGEAVSSLRAKGLWMTAITAHLRWDSPLRRGEVYTLLHEVDQRLIGEGW